jgi:hypothetical protein
MGSSLGGGALRGIARSALHISWVTAESACSAAQIAHHRCAVATTDSWCSSSLMTTKGRGKRERYAFSCATSRSKPSRDGVG